MLYFIICMLIHILFSLTVVFAKAGHLAAFSNFPHSGEGAPAGAPAAEQTFPGAVIQQRALLCGPVHRFDHALRYEATVRARTDAGLAT